jgi:hypothetical protein
MAISLSITTYITSTQLDDTEDLLFRTGALCNVCYDLVGQDILMINLSLYVNPTLCSFSLALAKPLFYDLNYHWFSASLARSRSR